MFAGSENREEKLEECLKKFLEHEDLLVTTTRTCLLAGVTRNKRIVDGVTNSNKQVQNGVQYALMINYHTFKMIGPWNFRSQT